MTRMQVLDGQISNLNNKNLFIVGLTFWILGVLGGHTFIGVIGGGYQSRFLLPMIPPCCILTALAWNSKREELIIPFVLCICYGVMGSLFYGVMFSPLFADFENSIFGIIFNVILRSPVHPLSSQFTATEVASFMKHYGVKFD